MTREKRISALANLRHAKRWKDKAGIADDTIDICIKALEQEPCEDAISRETARRIVDSGRSKQQMIDMILATPPVNPQEQYYKELVESYEKTINKLTKAIAEQEPKTGHWIEMALVEAGQPYSHKCSLCGRRILATDVGLSEFPYCHCGARMIEPQESEDKE